MKYVRTLERGLRIAIGEQEALRWDLDAHLHFEVRISEELGFVDAIAKKSKAAHDGRLSIKVTRVGEFQERGRGGKATLTDLVVARIDGEEKGARVVEYPSWTEAFRAFRKECEEDPLFVLITPPGWPEG